MQQQLPIVHSCFQYLLVYMPDIFLISLCQRPLASFLKKNQQEPIVTWSFDPFLKSSKKSAGGKRRGKVGPRGYLGEIVQI